VSEQMQAATQPQHPAQPPAGCQLQFESLQRLLFLCAEKEKSLCLAAVRMRNRSCTCRHKVC
jgi:hypothetical protein